MNRAEKEAVIGEVKTNISKAKAIFLTNLVGIESNNANAIRKSVRDVKGKLMITKNSLFEIAAKGTDYEKLLVNLKGSSAVAFAYDDVAAVAKCLRDAGAEKELVTLRGGMLDGKLLNTNDIKQLASLPSKPQMLATLLATFMAPASSFVRVLDAVREKKEKEQAA
ncbi:MAG: 50S ribosomal protein L10 [Bdellovibrionales bacterium RIFOXYB1_FULL_39_21]|nr:MAG: 50S ribosomal protein L10 [Bdellovibrionales bacterium RIFOXYB1_FULL_39_21]OFZ42095.1 MAG: 50S ribosomal protein L10 [Bdellovibrionales bacterium RIFOXYC12_FULL_39_17]OFZ50811.1 MAG: 50S ribosomal protein L10 [Bdellovibrionales bacterium RIFOXYC1_FULL_39_130]OFZ78034.1 MAG: 50S ribosomal protein L10 [Bdellovibrionales bacterium RIFOXYD1_FULL_39_84]